MFRPKSLRRVLNDKRMSMRALAKLMECAPATISRYCTGSREPRSAIVTKMAKALGCKIHQLEWSQT